MNDNSDEGAILTANPSAFAKFEFAVPNRLLAVSPPPELLPATHLVRTRIYRSALQKARSGSKVGAGIERILKKLAQRLRILSRSVPRRHRRASEVDATSIQSSTMYRRLEEEHLYRPIDVIVVFDVFDLPVALAFAGAHDVEVLVR